MLRRTRPVLALALSSILVPCALAGAQDATTAAQATQATPAPFEIEPVVVRGRTIPELEIKRQLIYAGGARMLDERKLDIFIDQEIKRQIEAGADAARFEITESEIDEHVKQAENEIREQYPDTPMEQILGGNQLTPERWRTQLTQAKLFDLVFFPADVELWPETTKEALRSGGRGDEFVEKIMDSWAAQVAAKKEETGAEEPATPVGQGADMLRMIMRQLVVGALNETADVRMASDGIPPEQVMVVNGVAVMTDDMYAVVEPSLQREDYERIRRWITKVNAVEMALAESGDLLSDEQFVAAFDEHEAPFKQSPINLSVLVLTFKKFPSMEAYKQYFRLLTSYERSIADELANQAEPAAGPAGPEAADDPVAAPTTRFENENLEAHVERASMLMGLAQVDLDVILLSAYDFAYRTWRENGWEQAAERATEVAKKLDEGADWDAMLEEYSEFYDPPRPKDQTMAVAPPLTMNKGRFGPLNRNELIQRFGESEYTIFLDGSSVADYAFFHQEPGTVDGPFRGQFGYYLTRVKGRVPPTKTMSLQDEGQRKLIIQDYVQTRFNEYAQDVMDAL